MAKETSTLTLLVSGAARPVVAELFALTVHQAPTSWQAERMGNVVLGIVLYGGLAALLVGVVRRARAGSRWMRLVDRGASQPTSNGSAQPGSSSS